MCAPCFTFALCYDCHTLFSAVLIYRRVDPSSGLKKVKPVPSVKEEATARNEKQSETEKEKRETEGGGGGGGVLPVIVTSSCRPKYLIAWNKLEYYSAYVEPPLLLRKSSGKGSFLAGSTQATRIRNPEEWKSSYCKVVLCKRSPLKLWSSIVGL